MSFFIKIYRVFTLAIGRFIKNGYNDRATALTYYTVFAIVPMAALLFGIAKGFSLEKHLKAGISENFSRHREFVEWVYRFADTTLREASGGLIAGIGVAALFWTVIMLASTVEGSFNAVWLQPGRRNMFRKAGDYLAIVLVTPVLLIVLGGTGVAARALLARVGTSPALHSAGLTLLCLAGDFAPLLVLCALFTAVYRFVPNARVRFTAALAGGIVAGILFQTLQSGFIYLQLALSRYNTIYGSFAVLPLFLFWLQFSWSIALFGAEIAFVWQNLGTGVFDSTLTGTSPAFRRLARLEILRRVVRAYCAGEPPPTVRELEDGLRISSCQARELVDSLLKCGLLRAVAALEDRESPDGPGLLPGVDPAILTVDAAVEKYESCGAVPDGTADALAAVRGVWRRFSEAARQSPGNPLIRSIESNDQKK